MSGARAVVESSTTLVVTQYSIVAFTTASGQLSAEPNAQRAGGRLPRAAYAKSRYGRGSGRIASSMLRRRNSLRAKYDQSRMVMGMARP
jgi:hypothetical protein